MNSLQKNRQQRGVTLIELMVGMVIGLLVIAVAVGALMVSRGVSGTVSDASSIQQQGAYVLRVIGQQMRQAGSLFLNPNPLAAASADALSPVVFEISAEAASGALSFKQENTISGDATTGSVTSTFRRYQDPVYTASTPVTLARNCLGGPAETSGDQAIESIFDFDSTKNELRCGGNGTAAQPIAQNVAQFQVTYLVQATDATGSKVQYTKASDMPAAGDATWRRVQGVQVCLVLYGSEPIDMPAGSSYTDCAGTSVNMTTLTGARKNRMHLLFRNTFQLRSQGLI